MTLAGQGFTSDISSADLSVTIDVGQITYAGQDFTADISGGPSSGGEYQVRIRRGRR